jgi:CheY-like chemotaxis protein
LLILQRSRQQVSDHQSSFIFADDGVNALSKLDVNPDIDMLLGDINMPRMDRPTSLLGRLQKCEGHPATVIVSAYGDMANIRTAMNLGAFDVVTKPIDFADLESTIAKTLRNPGVITARSPRIDHPIGAHAPCQRALPRREIRSDYRVHLADHQVRGPQDRTTTDHQWHIIRGEAHEQYRMVANGADGTLKQLETYWVHPKRNEIPVGGGSLPLLLVGAAGGGGCESKNNTSERRREANEDAATATILPITSETMQENISVECAIKPHLLCSHRAAH